MLYTDAQKQEHIEEILGLLYQIALRDRRIPIVLPQKEFTEEAALAVRAFQEAYGLPVTGEIDSETWNAIADTYRALTASAAPLLVFPSGRFQLQPGERSGLVSLVQSLLNLTAQRYRNIEPVPVTGIYDTDTEQAVRQLQQLSGLPETGILDRNTWNRLALLINSTVPAV